MSAISIRTSLVIHAPREQIWKTLTDFENYSTWTTVFRQFKGYAQKGKKLHFNINAYENVPVPIRECEILVANNADYELRWEGPAVPVIKDIFRGNHFFKLLKRDDMDTDLLHGEDFDGWLAPLLEPLLNELLHNLYNQFNRDLKRECERRWG